MGWGQLGFDAPIGEGRKFSDGDVDMGEEPGHAKFAQAPIRRHRRILSRVTELNQGSYNEELGRCS